MLARAGSCYAMGHGHVEVGCAHQAELSHAGLGWAALFHAGGKEEPDTMQAVELNRVLMLLVQVLDKKLDFTIRSCLTIMVC